MSISYIGNKDGLKQYETNVRHNFNIAIHGYGKNTKAALYEAALRLLDEIEGTMSEDDFKAIERFETVSVDENDTATDEEISRE